MIIRILGEGQFRVDDAATADLQEFADLTRTTWSVVDERRVRG